MHVNMCLDARVFSPNISADLHVLFWSFMAY